MTEEDPLNILKDIQSNTRQLTNEVNKIKQDNLQFISFMKKSEEKQKENELACIKLEEKVQNLQKTVILLNKTAKANNVILHNFPDETNNNLELFESVVSVLKAVITTFDQNDIDDLFRLGKQTGNRPILIKFKSQFAKRNFFQHASSLKEKNLSISHDLSKEERLERAHLRE